MNSISNRRLSPTHFVPRGRHFENGLDTDFIAFSLVSTSVLCRRPQGRRIGAAPLRENETPEQTCLLTIYG